MENSVDRVFFGFLVTFAPLFSNSFVANPETSPTQ